MLPIPGTFSVVHLGESVAAASLKLDDRVSIVERSRPGSGTTSASFAWTNANEKTPREYFEINLAGLEEHYRLCDELGGGAGAPWLHPRGNLEWAGDEEALEELDRRVERLRS